MSRKKTITIVSRRILELTQMISEKRYWGSRKRAPEELYELNVKILKAIDKDNPMANLSSSKD